MGYCIVDDVTKSFPRFVRDQAGSIADADIQGWLDDASGTVHAAFYNRGLDVNNLPHPRVSDPTATTPVMDQPNILRDMVRNYGIWRLASAIWATLSTTEQAMARGAYNRWETTLKGISNGLYDSIFWLRSRTTDVEPAFSGSGGADLPGGDLNSPIDQSTSRSFWKGQNF